MPPEAIFFSPNPPMTTDQFIKRVAARAGLSERETRRIYLAVLDEAKTVLSDGDVVRLPGLGRLQVEWKWDKFRPAILALPKLPGFS